MPIQFTCPHCQKTTTVADQYAGQTGPCQMCGQTITIPIAGGMPQKQLNAPPAHRSGGGGVAIVAIVLGVGFVLLLGCGGILAAMLFPAIRSSQVAAQRINSSNNLRMLAIALHNYQAAYDTFPPASIPDENGTPRTSWRASLLPYVEQVPLAEQYSFNHSWDSVENSFVQSIDIPSYHSPLSNEPATNTNYFLVTGPGTMFEDGRAPRLRDIRDGTSNTLLLVEVEGMNTHWAEPRDITYDELVQWMDSGQVSPSVGGVNAAMADGSSRFIPLDIDRQQLKAMTTHAGGEPVMLP